MNQASNSCEEKSSYLMPRCVLKKMPSKRYTTCGKDVQRAKKKNTHTHNKTCFLGYIASHRSEN